MPEPLKMLQVFQEVLPVELFNFVIKERVGNMIGYLDFFSSCIIGGDEYLT